MTIKIPNPPIALMGILDNWSGRFTEAKVIYQFFWLDLITCAGVIGDGDNGGYEWFVFNERNKTLSTSNAGYGSDLAALRALLTTAGSQL